MTPKTTALAIGTAVLATLGFLAYEGRVGVGDTVEVLASALAQANAVAVPAPIDPNTKIALKITAVSGDRLTGTAIGIVQNGQVVASPEIQALQVLQLQFPRSIAAKR